MDKKPWQSKTIVVNAVLALAGVVAVFVPGAQSVSAWINAHAANIAVGWGMLNVVLRLVTKDAISLGD